ncbi:Hypothetical protein YALI2_A00050g [Yarrowia lipolytica]|nr:Hypothetical protein YALI2_A00050g [Yarrowia lipolytica]
MAYFLSLCYSDFDKKMFEDQSEAFLDCGSEVERFFALDQNKLLVEFSGDHRLLIISTKDDWETLEQHREPISKLKGYLKVRYPHDKTLFSTFRNAGNKDVTIVCEDGVEVPVHSIVVTPQWPHFARTVNQSIDNTYHFTKLLRPSKWVMAMVSFFYNERIPMDLDTACRVLILALSYDIPHLGPARRASRRLWSSL